MRALLWICLLTLSIACACTPTESQPEDPPPDPATRAPAPTLDPAQATALARWEKGPHADTYDLTKGPNTYCARCHSPANWDPAAVIDPPPNCVSCKFPFEGEARVAAGNPMVPEQDWQSITCTTCHLERDGVVEQEIAWWDAATGYYETMANATALCEQCHDDIGQVQHLRRLGDAAHADFTCVDCHDAHDAAADCTEAGCHEEQALPWKPPVADMSLAPAPDPANPQHVDGADCTEAGCHEEQPTFSALDFDPTNARDDTELAHSYLHNDITCVACHDAQGLAVQPVEEGGPWITFRESVFLERVSLEPYQSHTLQLAVSCARCHYTENPWALEVYGDAE